MIAEKAQKSWFGWNPQGEEPPVYPKTFLPRNPSCILKGILTRTWGNSSKLVNELPHMIHMHAHSCRRHCLALGRHLSAAKKENSCLLWEQGAVQPLPPARKGKAIPTPTTTSNTVHSRNGDGGDSGKGTALLVTKGGSGRRRAEPSPQPVC